MARILSIFVMGLLCISVFAEELKIGMDAPDFALQDATDKNYKLKEMKGNVIVSIMGNRKIRKEDDKWAIAIQKHYSKNEMMKVFIIADMRSVPRFIPKGVIKWRLKKDKPPATLLLDWKGKTHDVYKTQPKKPNIFIISKLGKIAYRMDANYSDKAYNKLKAEIERALNETDVKRKM